MKTYYRLMLEEGGRYTAAAIAGGFIGVNFGIHQDLERHLTDDWRAFNKKFIPIFLAAHPDKTKIAAGLACGALWTLAKGMRAGDIVLSPDGSGRYGVAEVTGDYFYAAGDVLPHRRSAQWLSQSIDREGMSVALRRSAGARGTISNVTKHEAELVKLLGGIPTQILVSTDPTIEDPAAFAMEEHLEEFLVKNWKQTELGKDYEIYVEDGEVRGQQYPSDTGPIDILAVSKDKKRILVVELKKGRASDAVVGQVLRYMGYVQDELAEDGQTVVGAIIALEDDQRIRRALAMMPSVAFYRYQVAFKLLKA